MLDLGPNPVQEPECITVPVPLPQKVAVPAIPAPVPQVTTTLEKANFFSWHFLILFKKDKELRNKLSSYLGTRARFTVPANLSQEGGLKSKFHIRMK